jgi:glycolate oxidase FAD binding subunit
MATSTLESALAEVVGAKSVTRPDRLQPYAIDGIVPKAAASPRDIDELAGLIKLAVSEDLFVSPRGGGTMMAAGSPPERLDLVIATGRMADILEHEPAEMTATVQSGITLSALNAALAEHEQMLPLEAPASDRATIGGILATNANGPRRLAHGTARDRLIGVRVVDAEGAVIKGGGKVVKNVAGYDLNKLFIGSMGVLGIIAEATFKLAPLPQASVAMIGAFRTLEEAMAAAHALLKSGARPAALDLLNGRAYRAAASRAGLPGIADRDYFLAVDLAGTPKAVVRQTDQAHKAIVDGGGKGFLADDREGREKFWRGVVDLGRSIEQPADMITKASTLFTHLTTLVHGTEAMGESSHLDVAIDAHLPAGVLRSYWWGEGGGQADEAMLAGAVTTLRKATANVDGSFVVESCPTSMKKTVDVWGVPGPDVAIMRRIKEQFDPARRLNPGRFVGGL